MLSRGPLRATLVLALAFLCAAPSMALANGNARGKGDGAVKELLAEARAAVKEERFADAVSALRRAEAASPSPDTELELARALDRTGKLIEATALLRNVVDGPAKKPKDKTRVQAAKKLLAEVEQRTPRIEIVITGAGAASAVVTVNGKRVDAGELLHDPGNALIAVEAKGFYRAAKKIKLAPGARERIELKLKPAK